jgi:hypothetical protein
MRNQKTWEFAQRACSSISLKMFFPTAILAIVIMPLCMTKDINVISWVGLGITVVQLISYFIIIYLTERALKNEFK